MSCNWISHPPIVKRSEDYSDNLLEKSFLFLLEVGGERKHLQRAPCVVYQVMMNCAVKFLISLCTKKEQKICDTHNDEETAQDAYKSGSE